MTWTAKTTAASAPIRWGIIGCGDVTEVKSGPGLQKAKGSHLQAVMRRSARLAEDYARRHGVPAWYADASELVADPEVDAVYIATPPHAHETYVRMAAAAGKPVYVEKPMGRDSAEAGRMIAACNDVGIPLFVAYYRRALPRFLRVRDLIAQGHIGEPMTVEVSFREPAPPLDPDDPHWLWDPALSGGGLFVHMGCHTLDLLDFLLGPISRVEGTVRNQQKKSRLEDCVTASFEFASGVHGIGSWTTRFDSLAARDRTEIVGTEGSISFPTFSDEAVELRRDGLTKSESIDHPTHVQQPLIQAVVAALLGRGESPSTAMSAIRTRSVMDRLLAGYYERSGHAWSELETERPSDS